MTDRHHQQLKGLLEQAVPDDAPTLDPHAVAAAARRSRNRSRATVASVAALGVIGGGVAWAAFDGRGDDSGRVANDGSSAPYDAPACPTTLPDLADAASSVGSLDGLASVRMCPDLRIPGLSTAPPTAGEEEAILAGMDALVGDTSGFAEHVAATEPFDASRCAMISVFGTRQSLQLTYDDGRQVLLPTLMCSPITVSGYEVDGQYLGEAFLAALDHQRSNLDYARPYAGPLRCGMPTTPSPARPGREDLVAAVACGPADTVARLDERQLDVLAAAWNTPTPVPPSSPDTCRANPRWSLLVATDRGDVLRLRGDNCTHLTPELAWTYVDPTEGVAIPTTLEDLGLTP